MAKRETIMTLELTEEFKRLLEEAKAEFKRLHIELSDDVRKMIAEEVERQLNAAEHRIGNARHTYHKPTMEAK